CSAFAAPSAVISFLLRCCYPSTFDHTVGQHLMPRQAKWSSVLRGEKSYTLAPRMVNAPAKMDAFWRGLPAVHRSIQLPVHRQVRPLVRILSCKFFIKIHAQPRLIAWMHHSI